MKADEKETQCGSVQGERKGLKSIVIAAFFDIFLW